MAIVQPIVSFNSGEWSPKLFRRVDLEKYGSACKQLQNFIITPYGGVFRRPGTEYLGSVKAGASRGRLIPFNFSTATSFVLELGNQVLRVWQTNGQLVSVGTPAAWADATEYAAGDSVASGGTNYVCILGHTSDDGGTGGSDDGAGDNEPGVGTDAGTYWYALTGSTFELPAVWASADLRDIQWKQINDVVYLVHPDYPVQKLSRLANTKWVLEEVTWDWPPLLDENTTDTTLTLGATSGTGVSLTASADLFDAGHVGSTWQISHRRNDAAVDIDLDAAGTNESTALVVLGDWELTTYGNWSGTLLVQRAQIGSTDWETIRTYEASGSRNVSATGEELKEVQLRLQYTRTAAGSVSPRAHLEAGDSRILGLIKITAVTNATSATVTVVKNALSTDATDDWSEAAFSDYRGHPRTVQLHEQRLWFGGTTYRPQSLWASFVDDFQNFRVDTQDDAGLFFTLAATQGNAIQWLVSQQTLIIGTSADEYSLASLDDSTAIAPTSVRARRQSSYGSKYLPALVVNEVILFVQRQGRKVREFVFSFEKDGYVAPDLTQLAEHITEGDIVEVAFQQQPDAIYWAITGNGVLTGMTYERDQQVVGWHRHVTDGSFESVCTVYGGQGEADQVWFIVNREIDGNTVRYVERFKDGWKETLEAEEQDDWFYVDCGKVVTPSSGVCSGLDHLEGEQVSILADGAVEGERAVDGGELTLDDTAAAKAIVGLGFTSIIEPMDLHVQLRDGSSLGRKGRISHFAANFYKCLGGQFSRNGEDWTDFEFRTASTLMGSPPVPFTGDKNETLAGSHDDYVSILLRQTQPLPMGLMALVLKWEAYGD